MPTIMANNTPSSTDELDFTSRRSLFDNQPDVNTVNPNRIATSRSSSYSEKHIVLRTKLC